MYDPFTPNYAITDDWQSHLERGSSGGIDYAMGIGTALPAVDDGNIVNIPNYGTGGNTVRLYLDNGIYVEYMHLSQFALPNNTRVSAGDIIGYSGMSGAATGPHLHIHCYKNGVRQDFRIYLTGAADDGTRVKINNPVGGNMFILKNDANKSQWILVTVDGGQQRCLYLEDKFDKAVFGAMVPPLPVSICDEGTFNGYLDRHSYKYGKPVPLLEVKAV